MAAHIGQPTRSRRFIKVYLMTWALLAVGALAYLALLVFPPPAAAPSPQTNLDAAKSEPATDTPEVPKALAEVRALEGNLSEVRKDVSELQDAMGERVVNENVVQSRLTALEERVATIDAPQPAGDSPQPPQATEPNAKLPDKTARKGPETHTTADILAKAEDAPEPPAPPPAPPKAKTPPAAPIETGSIPSKAEAIFGKAIVTPAARTDFAVQLAAGPLQMVRRSWWQLLKRYRGSLAALKPRIAAPGPGSGIYRLLAGPIPTKADAERICEQMNAGPEHCFAAAYTGTPLVRTRTDVVPES